MFDSWEVLEPPGPFLSISRTYFTPAYCSRRALLQGDFDPRGLHMVSLSSTAGLRKKSTRNASQNASDMHDCSLSPKFFSDFKMCIVLFIVQLDLLSSALRNVALQRRAVFVTSPDHLLHRSNFFRCTVLCFYASPLPKKLNLPRMRRANLGIASATRHEYVTISFSSDYFRILNYIANIELPFQFDDCFVYIIAIGLRFVLAWKFSQDKLYYTL